MLHPLYVPCMSHPHPNPHSYRCPSIPTRAQAACRWQWGSGMLGGHVGTSPHCYGAPEQGCGHCREAATRTCSRNFPRGKENWYEDTFLGSHFTYKPPKLELLMKNASMKTKKENHVHLNALNGLLLKHQQICRAPLKWTKISDLTMELFKNSQYAEYIKSQLFLLNRRSTQKPCYRNTLHMRHLFLIE